VDVRTGVLRLPRVAAPVRLLLALLGVLVVVVAVSGDVRAQNQLVSSEPADGDTLPTSPEEIVLEFEEPVGTANRVDASCNSNPVTGLAQPVVSNDDRRTLTVPVLQPLPQGTCVVVWRVSEANGQPGGNGTITFEVASAPTTTSPTDDTTPGSTTPTTTPVDETGDGGGAGESELDPIDEGGGGFPLWLGQMLSILGLSVVFGALLLLAVAWPEGPEYVIAVRFIRMAWVVALVGTVVYVAALTALATGKSFGASLNPVEWAELLDAGWPGRAALARLLLVVAAGWSAGLPERVVEPSTQMPALVIPALAVATIGLTRTGGDVAALGVAMGVIHALAMAVWLGGVIFVSRIVLAGSGEEDLVHATRGFNRIAMPALAITVITGLVQLVRLDGGELFSEPHGRILLLKTLVVAAVVFIAMSVHQLVQARLSRARALDAPMANRLRRAFGVDAALGVVVVGLTAWMLQYPAPNVDADTVEDREGIVERIDDPASGIELEVIVTPGRVGNNQLIVKVYEPEADLRGLEVTFVPPENDRVGSIRQSIPLTGRGMASTTPDAPIPFRIAGTWRLEVSARTNEGAISQAGGAFTIERRGARTTGGTTVTTDPDEESSATTG
jgi:copper transport protein